jgi:hypothetical protein
MVARGKLSTIATSLGRQLADQVAGAVLSAAGHHAAPRAIDRADVATEFRAAIQELQAERHDEQLSGRGIAVFIASDQQLIDALALTATDDEQWRHRAEGYKAPTARDELLIALSLSDPETAWHLAGKTDGAVVIQTHSLPAPAGDIVVIDLTRFVRMRMAASAPDGSSEPQLELSEPDEARVRADCLERLAPSDNPDSADRKTGAAEGQPAALEDCVRETLLQVTLYLRQHGEIAVEDTTAARILTWRQSQQAGQIH